MVKKRKHTNKPKKQKTKETQVIFDVKSHKDNGNQAAKWHNFKATKKIRPWLEDKIKSARKLGKHPAARTAGRLSGPAGVALIVAVTFYSLLSPKTDFQKTKERLVQNPQDFEAHLVLAKMFLDNHQLEEAEKLLLLAQKIKRQNKNNSGSQNKKVLGEKADAELNKLWEEKHNLDPKDIEKLISAWEEIINEKPDYRDGHLQLAVLYYKIFKEEKAKEHLQKALELDPNYEPARELEKTMTNE